MKRTVVPYDPANRTYRTDRPVRLVPQARLIEHREASYSAYSDGLIHAACKCGWSGPLDLGTDNDTDYIAHIEGVVLAGVNVVEESE